MASRFFINRRLKKKIQKDIKKRTDIEDKIKMLNEELIENEKDISNDLDDFYHQTDEPTVLSTIKHYEEHSQQKKKDLVKEIREKYNAKNLSIEDTLTLTDWYEKMCEYHNSEI